MEVINTVVYVNGIVWDQFFVHNNKLIPSVAFCCSKTTFKNVDKAQETSFHLSKLDSQFYNLNCIHCVTHVIDILKINPDVDKDELDNKICLSSNDRCVILNHKHIIHMNGLLLSIFYKELQRSEVYRKCVINNLKKRKCLTKDLNEHVIHLSIHLVSSQQNVLDYGWNERMERLAVERRELDNAMSWFSTLGGAFSALGDDFEHCAMMAGKISLHQWKIALRLGDPTTVARCKLYLALSLLQRGNLSMARAIVEEQYRLTTRAVAVDTRLVNMCRGIWAKLQYTYQQRRGRKSWRADPETLVVVGHAV